MADTPKAVLFDIDGTLVVSNELHVEAWLQAFAEAREPQDAAAIRAQIGKGGDNLVPTLLPGADAGRQERIADAHGRVFKAQFLRQAKPFPGAHDLLARVHAEGIAVVLASSASAAEIAHYVDLLGAGDLVAVTTSIDDVGTSKPAPDIFSVALEKLGRAAPAEALVIGDTPWDAEAAVKAGVRPIGVLSGGVDAATLREAGMTALYDDVADLLARYDTSPLAGRS